jgi:hypothetical protein
MSQSQATTERMLEDHAKTMTWADITLGITRKQIKEHEKELAATARSKTEMENDYNFKDGHWVDPGKGKKDDGRAATLAMRVSLGDTENNIVNGGDSSYLSDLAEELYKDNDNCRDMDIDMAAVHQDTGRTLALQDRKGKDTAKDNQEVEKQPDTPDENSATLFYPPLSGSCMRNHLRQQGAAQPGQGADSQLKQRRVCLGG